MDQKADQANFNQVLRAVENKADRFELGQNRGSPELEGRLQQLSNEMAELGRKADTLDKQFIKNIKEQDMDLENVRQQLMSSLQTKADHRDIDSLGKKLHGKADCEKLQTLMSDIR